MKYIGMLDGLPVYEVKRGAYLIVNPETERVIATWLWYGTLGRNYDTFMRGGENPDDEKCVEIIEKNMESLLKRLNDVAENAEDDGKEFLDEQDEFYDSLEEGREFDWMSGEYLDE